MAKVTKSKEIELLKEELDVISVALRKAEDRNEELTQSLARANSGFAAKERLLKRAIDISEQHAAQKTEDNVRYRKDLLEAHAVLSALQKRHAGISLFGRIFILCVPPKDMLERARAFRERWNVLGTFGVSKTNLLDRSPLDYP
jgi:hypothetical protein